MGRCPWCKKPVRQIGLRPIPGSAFSLVIGWRLHLIANPECAAKQRARLTSELDCDECGWPIPRSMGHLARNSKFCSDVCQREARTREERQAS